MIEYVADQNVYYTGKHFSAITHAPIPTSCASANVIVSKLERPIPTYANTVRAFLTFSYVAAHSRNFTALTKAQLSSAGVPVA